jgi:hypothetical protein
MRARGARHENPTPGGVLASTAPDGMALGDHELRTFCRRLLGWSSARAEPVDAAIDHLLAAVARRTPIALRGTSDLVPVAFALHRRIFGSARPFVVCDRRRRDGEGSVRVPPSRPTCLLALEAAMDGSLCLRSNRMPSDIDRLCLSRRNDSPSVAVFVCLHDDDAVRDLLCRPLDIPSLSAHAPEAERLVQESIDDAAGALGAASVRIAAIGGDHLRRDQQA